MLTATKCLNRGLRSTMCTRRFRHLWAACSLTILNEFGRTWQVLCEARSALPLETRKTLGSSMCATVRDRMCRFRARKLRDPLRPGIHPALQRVPVGGDHRQRRAGYSSEQATAALEDVFKQTMPHEMGFDYMGMSIRAESPPRGSRMGHLWPLAALRIPGVGRAV